MKPFVREYKIVRNNPNVPNDQSCITFYLCHDYLLEKNVSSLDILPANIKSIAPNYTFVNDETMYSKVLSVIKPEFHHNIYMFIWRRNGTYRPNRRLTPTLLSQKLNAYIMNEVFLFIDTKKFHVKEYTDDSTLLFIKFIDNSKKLHLLSLQSDSFASLIKSLKTSCLTGEQIMRITFDLTRKGLCINMIKKIFSHLDFSMNLENMNWYEEVRYDPRRFDLLNTDKSFSDLELRDGDILWIVNSEEDLPK